MLITQTKNKRKQEHKISEKTTELIKAIMLEIEEFEKYLGKPVFKSDSGLKILIEGEEFSRTLKESVKKIQKLGGSVYIPFSISDLLKKMDEDPIDTIGRIYRECESWLHIKDGAQQK